MNIQIEASELQRVYSALMACMVSGGGSPTWSLMMKLSKQADLLGVDLDWDGPVGRLVPQLSEACLSEAEEAGVISRC